MSEPWYLAEFEPAYVDVNMESDANNFAGPSDISLDSFVDNSMLFDPSQQQDSWDAIDHMSLDDDSALWMQQQTNDRSAFGETDNQQHNIIHTGNMQESPVDQMEQGFSVDTSSPLTSPTEGTQKLEKKRTCWRCSCTKDKVSIHLVASLGGSHTK